MTYQIATITKQGQITIPAHVMVKVGLRKPSKVLIGVQDSAAVVIKPAPDIMTLAGTLRHKAHKNLSLDAVVQLENKAIAEGWTEQATRERKRRVP